MDSSEEAWKELNGLRENFRELREGVEELIKDRGIGATNSSASQITVNGGTWVSYLALSLVLATIFALALASLLVAFQLSDLRRQDETFQAYIHAGYVQPEAKEEKPK